jgi:hypothetical protein
MHLKINKDHELWKSAPWYIRYGALGIKTYKGIQFCAASCFLLSLVALSVGVINIYLTNYFEAIVSLSLVSFGISAYLYALIQVWLLTNREVIEHDL